MISSGIQAKKVTTKNLTVKWRSINIAVQRQSEKAIRLRLKWPQLTFNPKNGLNLTVKKYWRKHSFSFLKYIIFVEFKGKNVLMWIYHGMTKMNPVKTEPSNLRSDRFRTSTVAL